MTHRIRKSLHAWQDSGGLSSAPVADPKSASFAEGMLFAGSVDGWPSGEAPNGEDVCGCWCVCLTMEARLQRWGMMYMKMRRGHCKDGSVMKKPEKRNDANLPRTCNESVWTGSGSQRRTHTATADKHAQATRRRKRLHESDKQISPTHTRRRRRAACR